MRGSGIPNPKPPRPPISANFTDLQVLSCVWPNDVYYRTHSSVSGNGLPGRSTRGSHDEPRGHIRQGSHGVAPRKRSTGQALANAIARGFSCPFRLRRLALHRSPNSARPSPSRVQVAEALLKANRFEAALDEGNKLLVSGKLKPAEEAHVHLLLAQTLEAAPERTTHQPCLQPSAHHRANPAGAGRRRTGIDGPLPPAGREPAGDRSSD